MIPIYNIESSFENHMCCNWMNSLLYLVCSEQTCIVGYSNLTFYTFQSNKVKHDYHFLTFSSISHPICIYTICQAPQVLFGFVVLAGRHLGRMREEKYIWLTSKLFFPHLFFSHNVLKNSTHMNDFFYPAWQEIDFCEWWERHLSCSSQHIFRSYL